MRIVFNLAVNDVQWTQALMYDLPITEPRIILYTDSAQFPIYLAPLQNNLVAVMGPDGSTIYKFPMGISSEIQRVIFAWGTKEYTLEYWYLYRLFQGR